MIENPATRSDPTSDLFRWVWRSHASLWMHPLVVGLMSERWVRSVTFPQCALSGDFQKWTTLIYSIDLHHMLEPLGHLKCTHTRHAKQAAGLDEDGKWRSAEAAAYPAEMNARLAAVGAAFKIIWGLLFLIFGIPFRARVCPGLLFLEYRVFLAVRWCFSLFQPLLLRQNLDKNH